MENDFSETLKKLLAISKIDANLAGINAEKSSLDKKLAEMKEALLSASFDYKKKYAAHEAKNSSYQKEEKRIRDSEAGQARILGQESYDLRRVKRAARLRENSERDESDFRLQGRGELRPL